MGIKYNTDFIYWQNGVGINNVRFNKNKYDEIHTGKCNQMHKYVIGNADQAVVPWRKI